MRKSRFRPYFLVTVTMVFTPVLAWCGDGSGEEKPREERRGYPIVVPSGAEAGRTPPPSSSDQTGQSNEVDVFIVPGWGYEMGPLLGFDYKKYAAWFPERGIPLDHVHILNYSYLDELPKIDAELKQQMAQVLDQRPATSRFDVLGHSLGGFTGLMAIMGFKYQDRARKFISVSGIPFGWNNTLCAVGMCGKAHLSLTPFHSAYINEFHQRNQQVIARLDKCSLFSPDDAFVKPYDAGRFSDGKSLEVPGMGHLAAIGDKANFTKMFDTCYGQNAQGLYAH